MPSPLILHQKNPKVRPKKFDGSFPMAKEVNQPQEKSGVSSLKEPRNERRTHDTKQNNKGREGKVSTRVHAHKDKQL